MRERERDIDRERDEACDWASGKEAGQRCAWTGEDRAEVADSVLATVAVGALSSGEAGRL